jgi:chromate transport protein ChrA
MEGRSRSTRIALAAVRYVLPAALVAVGVTLVLLRTSDEAAGMGVGLAMAALIVFLLNAFMRAGLRSQRDRDREEEARAHFDRYGRWPGDDA